MAYSPFTDNDDYTDLLQTLLKQLDKLPAPLRKEIEKDLQDLISLIEESRYPRFVLVGRRGAGKTTLLNAIFEAKVGEVGSVRAQTGATSWKTYEATDGKRMHILDTRGVQEGNRPAEADSAASSEESVLQAIRDASPDAFLFLIKAKEVNAAIEGDIAALLRFMAEVKKQHGYDPLVVGIVTQCDELDPPYIRTAHDRQQMPEEWQAKLGHIAQAVADLRGHLEQHEAIRKNLKVAATSAFVRFRADGSLDPRIDYRWGIDDLIELLIEELPAEAQLQFARLARVRHYQRRIAQKVVVTCSGVSFTIGLQPLPLADMPILATIQTMMVMTIAYISGLAFSWQNVKDFLKAAGINVGAGYVFRQLARGIIKLLPFAGEVISGAVAAAGTRAIGELAVAYFIDGVGMEEARQRAAHLLNEAYEQAKGHQAPAQLSDADLDADDTVPGTT